MIPKDLPLPHSSSTHRMSQREKDELAEQWYAMMIKEDIDGSQNDANSTMSTLTPSTSSQRSQRDNRSHKDHMYKERLLDQNVNYTDHQNGYRIKKITPHYGDDQQQDDDSEPQSREPTDFLDGIIKSLSELSNGSETRPTESKTNLQEKKKGWSIIDSQRRLEENYRRSKLEERTKYSDPSSANATVASYPPQSDYEKQRRKNSPDFFDSRSLPTMRRNNRLDEERQETGRGRNQTGTREGESSPKSRYEPYSSSAQNSNNFPTSRSWSHRSDGKNIPSDRSQRSAKTLPTDHRKPSRPWNIDASLRNIEKSLLDDPTSPASEYTPVDSNKKASDQPQIPPISLPSMVENIKGLFQEEPNGTDKYSTISAPRSHHDTITITTTKKTPTRDRSPSLAFSSSKNAEKILQHFMPKSCGPMDGESAIDGVVDFFDAPVRSINPPRNRSRSRSKSRNRRRSDERSKNRKKTPTKTRRSPEPFKDLNNSDNKKSADTDDENIKLPKTRSQRSHEEEILRGTYYDLQNAREGHTSGASSHQHHQQRRRKQGASLPEARQEDGFPSWGSSEEYHEPRASGIDMRDNSENSSSLSNLQFPTNFESLASSLLSERRSQKLGRAKSGVDVLQQFTLCNAPEQLDSPTKFFNENYETSNESASSPAAINMFENIQRKLTTEPQKLDLSGFPLEDYDDVSKSDSDQDKRIQEKLDAVRAKSMRNAQTYLLLESEKQAKIFKEDQVNASAVAAINRSSGSVSSSKKSLQLYSSGDSTATPEASNISSSKSAKPRNTTQMEMASEITSYENEVAHYMYVAYSKFGQEASSVLKLCGHHTIPAPDRRKGEILIRINMSTISATDCAIRRGEWKKIRLDPYIIPGTALIGRVMGREKKHPRGPSSACIEPGDSVLSLAPSGGNARYICLQKSNLIKINPKLNPERVLCLAETYLTAFQVLHMGQKGGMRYRDNCFQGKSILVMDGFSPLGKAIIELARLGGAAICYGLIGGGGSESFSTSVDVNQQYKIVEQWGAIPLSNDPQEWLTLIGRQIDILVTNYDPNRGGENAITADHWKALRKEGQVYVVCSHPRMTEIEQRNLILNSQDPSKGNDAKAFRIPSCRLSAKEKLADRAAYYNLFDNWEGDRLSRVMARKDLEHLVKLLEVDLIHPEVAERFPLSKVAKAHRSLEENKILGHYICLPWQRDRIKNKQQENDHEEQGRGGKFLI